MSETSSSADPLSGPRPSLGRIFWVFLVMGATSLGGGVVGYLRTGLVVRNNWLDDVTFVELLSISQTLPGLNATNMSILVGDRLRGAWGALLATLGMCLPGATLMTAAAFAYGIGGDDPWSKAFLHGIAAGALGLIVVVMVQLGSRVLKGIADYVIVLATAAAVALFGVQVPYALIAAGIVAIWWHRPRDGKGPRCQARIRRTSRREAPRMKQLGDIAGVFAYLSLLTVGGGMAAFPELKTLTVDTYHWVTFPEMLHFYSLGQLAPGPNMMMVVSIGAVVAGLPGAAVALIAFFLPTGILTWAVGRLWTHLATWRWRPAIQTGLGSVSVGLVLAGAIIMGRGAVTDALCAAVAIVVFFLLLKTKINPAYPIVASGLVGPGARLLLPDRGPPGPLMSMSAQDARVRREASGRHLGVGLPGRTTCAARRSPRSFPPLSGSPCSIRRSTRRRRCAGCPAPAARRWHSCPRSSPCRSTCSGPALAFAVAIGADEAIDRAAMLGPLRLARTVRLAGAAGALPHHLVLRFGMPVPHAAAGLGVEQPSRRCRTARSS